MKRVLGRFFHFSIMLSIAFLCSLDVRESIAQENATQETGGQEQVQSSTEETQSPAQSAGEEVFDPTAEIEVVTAKKVNFATDIESIQKNLEVASATPVVTVLNRQLELAQNIDLVFTQQISAYEQWITQQSQLLQVKAEREMLESATDVAPISFLELNLLREQLTLEENRKQTVETKTQLAESSLEQAKESLNQRIAQRSDLQVKLDNAQNDEERELIQHDMKAAQYAVRAASETILLREAEIQTQTLATELYQAQLAFLQEKVDRVEENVVFPQKDLNDQFDRLEKETFSVNRDLKKATDQKATAANRITEARSQFAKEPSDLNQQAVQTRIFESELNDVKIDMLNGRLLWIPKRRTVWQQRFDTFHDHVDKVELLAWKEEALNNVTVLEQENQTIGLRIDERQSELSSIRNNLSSVDDESGALAKQYQAQEKILQDIIDVLRDRRSRIDTTVRLHEKLVSEINVKIAQQSWNEYVQTVLRIEFYGNSIKNWLYSIAVIIAVFISLYCIRWVSILRLQKMADGNEESVAFAVLEVIRRTRPLFFLMLSVFIATRFLALSAENKDFIKNLMMVALIFQGAIMASYFLRTWIMNYLMRKSRRDPTSMSALAIFNFISQLVVWSFASILAFSNLGYDVTGLITGLGIGGIAVALAIQRILGDLFASLSIVLDKPFVQGDFIVFGEYLGAVEHIGIKTTRIRSLTGEQIVCSNSDLLNTHIRNFKRMRERRVVFAIGVIYQTTAEQLEKIPGIVREIIEEQKQARFDRAHFSSFGDFSLNYEIVYYVLSNDYAVYMDIQQQVNLKIFRRFAEEGIEFAYPTQTLQIESSGSNGDASTRKMENPTH